MKMGFEGVRGLKGAVYGVECGGKGGNFSGEDLENGTGAFGGNRVCCEVDDSKEIDSVLEAASMVFSMRNSNFAFQKAGTADLIERASRETKIEKNVTDDFEEIVKEPLGYGYEVGDMVWGKVKSYPWWPGQIFDEAFAVTSVCETKKEGHVLVAFFGDSSYGWFDPMELIPFDPHYAEKSMQTNAWAFVSAVEDAKYEARRRAALGLVCRCRSPFNFRSIDVGGYYAVDVGGYEPQGVYSVKQIRRARDGFCPVEMLSFVQKLALMPCSKLQENFDWTKVVAKVLSYRMAVFEEVDETYSQAFAAQSVRPGSSMRVLDQRKKASSQGLAGKRILTVDKKAVLKQLSSVNAMDNRERNMTELIDMSQGSEQPQPRLCEKVENHNGLEKKYFTGRIKPPLDTSVPKKVCFTTSGSMDENPKALKRYGEDLSFEEAIAVDKKKKKTELNLELGMEHPYNHLRPAKTKALARQSAGKSSQIGLVHRKDSLIDQQEKDNGVYHTISSDSVAKQKTFDVRNIEIGLPQLISNLLALALDPFHGVEQKIPAILFQFFLQFRSVVYQKSLVVSSSDEAELIETQPTKPPAFIVTAESPPIRSVQDVPISSRPPKKRLKPDYYVNAGHGINTFDCGEEMPTKGQKNLNELKSLTAEKKASGQKPLKSLGKDRKEVDETIPKKQIDNILKKPITPKRVVEPTILVMNFPRQSALPSVSELKAKFARFGPLDHSATYVSWKASKCRIAFKCKYDAHAAHKYAVQHGALFGNLKVYYQLQSLESSAPESQILGKQLVEEAIDNVPKLTSLSSRDPAQSELQPKSCLKKTPGNEVRSNTGIPGKTPHVKFNLGGGASNGGEELVIGSNIKNLNDNHLGDCSSPSFATNFNTTVGNFQKVKPLALPPLLPLPNQILNVAKNYEVGQFVEACNLQYCQVESKNNHICTSATSQSVDISHPTLNLLIRCSEILDELNGSLGYVPLFL